MLFSRRSERLTVCTERILSTIPSRHIIIFTGKINDGDVGVPVGGVIDGNVVVSGARGRNSDGGVQRS